MNRAVAPRALLARPPAPYPPAVDAAAWIRRLDLEANPEGGHFAVHHRGPDLPGGDPLVTVIYYLLDAAAPRARLHATAGASLHYHHAGGALRVHTLDERGAYRAQRLGPPHDLQVFAPPGAWKALELLDGPWALISEAVVPGWTPAGHRVAAPDLLRHLDPVLQDTLSPFLAPEPQLAAGPPAPRAAAPAPPISADTLRAALDLAPHPEGGSFRETWGAADRVATPRGERPLANTIYYLLDAASPVGHLHWNASPITHLFHAGAPIRYLLIDPQGALHERVLGPDPAAGHALAFTCPGGWWKASTLPPGAPYGLISEVVAPGFDYADQELARAADLPRRFPQHQARLAGLVAP